MRANSRSRRAREREACETHRRAAPNNHNRSSGGGGTSSSRRHATVKISATTRRPQPNPARGARRRLGSRHAARGTDAQTGPAAPRRLDGPRSLPVHGQQRPIPFARSPSRARPMVPTARSRCQAPQQNVRVPTKSHPPSVHRPANEARPQTAARSPRHVGERRGRGSGSCLWPAPA